MSDANLVEIIEHVPNDDVEFENVNSDIGNQEEENHFASGKKAGDFQETDEKVVGQELQSPLIVSL